MTGSSSCIASGKDHSGRCVVALWSCMHEYQTNMSAGTTARISHTNRTVTETAFSHSYSTNEVAFLFVFVCWDTSLAVLNIETRFAQDFQANHGHNGSTVNVI